MDLLRLVENGFHCDHNPVTAKMEQSSLPQVINITQPSHSSVAVPTAHQANQTAHFPDDLGYLSGRLCFLLLVNYDCTVSCR
jgi:hypothetical protein